MSLRVYTRSEWGARHRAGFGSRRVGGLRVFKHHTVMTHLSADATVAQEMAEMRRIEQVGQDRFGGGISYTWIIFPSGRIYEGTGVSRVGAHTGGYNTAGAAICWAGNYQTHKATPQQINATGALLDYGQGRWWPVAFRYDPHRAVKSTSCPGDYAVATMSGERAIANGQPGTGVGPAEQKWSMGWTTLQYGDTGDDVGALQDYLNAFGYALVRDESFGPATLAAVQDWQGDHGLKPDGAVGPATQSKMAATKAPGKPSAPAVKPPAAKTRKPRTLPQIAYGFRGGWASLWEKVLRDEGLYHGPIDESFGPGLRDATVAFQRRRGLKPDGICGLHTWSSALLADGTLELGDVSPYVEVWQNVIGVAPDESFGYGTQDGTYEVQRYVGVTVDGRVGQGTVDGVRRSWGI